MLGQLQRSVEATVRRHTSMLALRLIVALALTAALLFALAAVLIHVGSLYGPVVACGVGAAVFLVIAAIGAIVVTVGARRREREARERAAELKSSVTSLLATPSRLLLGATLAKKAFGTIPLALIGGLVLGYVVSRPHRRDDTKSSE